MKKFVNILVLLVAVAFAGCRTDNDFGLGGAGADDTSGGGNQTLGRKVTVAAISSADSDQEEFDPTRAKLNQNYDYLWTKGDQIGLFATDLDATTEYVHNMCLTNLHKDDARDADFEGYLPEGYVPMPATHRYWYAAYYPHHEGVALHLTEGQNPRLTGLSLSAEQTPTGAGVEGFRTDLATMVSSVSGNTITQENINHGVQLGFEHLFAVVEFTYNVDRLPDANQRRITKLTLRAEGKAIAGDYDVEFTNQGPQLNFTNPLSEVTIDMKDFEGGGLAVGQSVFAVVNPVLNGEVEVDVETSTGYNFTCFCTVKSSEPAAWHTTKFDIPVFEIELDNPNFAYTSYTLYKAGNISAANGMSGNAVAFNTPSYSFSSPNDNATMRYQPKDVKGVEKLVDGKSATSGLSVGLHKASFNVALSDGQKVISPSQDVHVTGIPYSVDCRNTSLDDAINAGWTFTGTVEEKGGWQTLYSYLGTKNYGSLFSPVFYTPSEVNVTYTARMCYFTTGTGNKSITIFSGVTTGTTEATSNRKEISRVNSVVVGTVPNDSKYTNCTYNVTIPQGDTYRISIADNKPSNTFTAQNWVCMGEFNIVYR